MGRKRPRRSSRCSRTESTALTRAARRSLRVERASPWMNSAPSSTGASRPAMRRVQQRPPTRARASSTITERPARVSASAAASPAAPAPMIRTSASMRLLHLHIGISRDLAPDADLLLDLRAKLLGRASGRRHAIGLKLLRGRLDMQDLGYFAVQTLHDIARKSF